MIDSPDQLYRFTFEECGVRGELIQLEASWQATLARYDYPDTVASQLGQALAATLLLSATIKFDGSLILQSQSSGPLKTLVAQATSERTLRGLARWEGDIPEGNLQQIYGHGNLVITIDNRNAERYQGIVTLSGEQLSDALESYFSQSEQLPSRFWLAADRNRATGLFIQRLPRATDPEDHWQRIEMLSDTLSKGELLELNASELLYRLYHEESVRLYDPEPVAFRCGCSRERIEKVLLAMGRQEIETLLQEQPVIETGCEFCNRQYQFDPIDIKQLFSRVSVSQSPTTRQ